MKLSVVAVVGLLLVAACDKGKEASSGSSSTAGGGGGGTTSSKSDFGAAPVVKVLDAGKDAKRALRFTPAKDTKQTMVMTMDMGLTMDLGNGPNHQQVPTVEMLMDVAVTDVAANGDIKFKFSLASVNVLPTPGIAPQVADAMKSAMAGMDGLAGSATVTSRGFSKDVDIKTPPGANPQVAQFLDSIKQSIGQMTAPFPEEPVGLGAKWDTTMKISQNGMNMSQIAHNEVIALDDKSVTLALKIEQSAPKQTINKDGMSATLESYKGGGSGETNMTFTSIVPTKASIGLKSEMEMKAAGQSMSLGLDVTMKMGVK